MTTDLFYDPDGKHADPGSDPEPDPDSDPAGPGGPVLAIEMETATLFRLAELRGVQAGCVLAVSDLLGPARGRIDAEAMEQAAQVIGRIGAAALP